MVAPQTFQIKGSYKQHGYLETFTKLVPGISEPRALDKMYSQIGSNHGIKRHLIKIESINVVKPKEKKQPAAPKAESKPEEAPKVEESKPEEAVKPEVKEETPKASPKTSIEETSVA